MNETKENSPLKIHRFPGVASFGDDDVSCQLFFGRDTVAEKLLYYVLCENLTVLFSYSGYGKTSLLKTKVFQALKERQHFPVLIRFNESGIAPVDMIKLRVTENARKQHYQVGPFDATDPAAEGYLSRLMEGDLPSFFKELEIWSPEYKLLTPVLVFDQFEEIFTLEHNAETRTVFFDELAWLVNPLGGGRLNLRFLLSIREDLLGRLENLAEHIPTVFTNRFQLKPLSRANAEEAILRPAAINIPGVDFASPPFEFSSEAIKFLIEFTSKLGTNSTGSKEYLDPVQLQVICRELEDRVQTGEIRPDEDGKIVIRESDLGGSAGLDDIIGNFYWQLVLRLETELALSPDEIASVRDIVEKEMILGVRRVPVVYSAILEKGINQRAIDFLIEQKLLRSETSHSGSLLLELSHDTLVNPVLKFYEERRALEETEKNLAKAKLEKARKEEQRKRLAWGSAVAVVMIICGIFIFRWNENRKEIKAQNQATQQRFLSAALKQIDVNPTLSFRIASDGNAIDESSGLFTQMLDSFKAPGNGWVFRNLHTDADIIAAGFAESEKEIIAFDNHTIYKWSESGILKQKLLLKDQILEARILPGHKTIVICRQNFGDTIIIRNDNGEKQQTLLREPFKNTYPIAISNDGQLILLGDAIYSGNNPKPVAIIRTPATNRPDISWYFEPSISTATFTPDGQLICCSSEGHLLFYNTNQLSQDTINPLPKDVVLPDHEYGVSIKEIQNGILIVSSEGNLFTWQTGADSLQDIGDLDDGSFTFGVAEDGKNILAIQSAQCRMMDMKGNVKATLKQKINTVQFAGFSDSGKSALLGCGNQLIIWYPGKPDSNRLALYSPYDYYLAGFTEKDYNVSNVYETGTLDGLLIATENYAQRVLDNYQEGLNPAGKSLLEVALVEIEELHNQLFSHPGFSSDVHIDTRKHTYITYAHVIENTAGGLYEYSDEPAFYRQKALADSLHCIALLLDTTEFPSDAQQVAESLMSTGRYFKNSGKGLDKAMQCFRFADMLAKAYLLKNPENDELVSLIIDASEGMILCYNLSNRETEAKLLSTQLDNFIQLEIKDSVITNWEVNNILYQRAQFYRDSLLDYPAALSCLRGTRRTIDKNDRNENRLYLSEMAVTFLYAGNLDSALYYSNKSVKILPSSQALSVQICIPLLQDKLATAKSEQVKAQKKYEYFSVTALDRMISELERRGRPMTAAIEQFRQELAAKTQK